MDADGDPMGEAMADDEDEPQTLVPRVEFADEQDPDHVYASDITQGQAQAQGHDSIPDDELMQEMLRQQIQEELEAASVPQGVKRAPPTVNEADQEASDAYHDGLEEEPVAAVSKRKTAPSMSKRRVVTGGARKVPKTEQGSDE